MSAPGLGVIPRSKSLRVDDERPDGAAYTNLSRQWFGLGSGLGQG